MPGRPSGERRGEAPVALLLTWFLPGAGHVYLGRWKAGVLAFLFVEGLYAVGLALSGGRTFEFLDPELRGTFATILSPEVGNLGAMLYQLKTFGFGMGEPLPFPRFVELGSLLAALSGMLNVFLMVHVHLDARTPASAPRRGLHPVLLTACAWALPGLGHWLQGRRRRAVWVALTLLGLFVAGTWMAEGTNLSRIRHFYYWSGQFLLGLPALATELASGRPPVRGEIPLVDAGLLYACMPGLLNVLGMLDVFGVAERRWLGLGDPPATPGDSRPVRHEPEAG